ncbi:ImmA/IrrE family metallo-endopeptidase [Candidatus Enterococcus clewellii]|uniref:IrrE N-terminal-like domain-containing protein n=1 Tax=Candidatus Enterococcus clewellii TaxID=1834193 RepID=A0A242K9K2_9ENTE|nr:ImmA/IrrE family metallo-endopeptidase [Enterococcus sp. 9E7_DIV0242]OTP17458.1 hypothetical protein A5888_001596 [Enterococcus sp. 9E7_DIV0242]
MNNAAFLMSSFPNINFVFDPRMPEVQKGLYVDNVVYLNPRQNQKELYGVISEEIGHHYTSSGIIRNQKAVETRKQERKARLFGSELTVTPDSLILAKKDGCRSEWETAEFLGVTVEHLRQALRLYKEEYGIRFIYKGYLFKFGTADTLYIKKMS